MEFGRGPATRIEMFSTRIRAVRKELRKHTEVIGGRLFIARKQMVAPYYFRMFFRHVLNLLFFPNRIYSA